MSDITLCTVCGYQYGPGVTQLSAKLDCPICAANARALKRTQEADVVDRKCNTPHVLIGMWQDAWADSWDCSCTPGHPLMQKVAALTPDAALNELRRRIRTDIWSDDERVLRDAANLIREALSGLMAGHARTFWKDERIVVARATEKQLREMAQ